MENQKFDVVAKDGQKPIKMWTRGVQVEDVALQQLENVASLPFIHKHVAAMPDVHWGIGATVGSVIATKAAIIPAAVGVDIGCGMMWQRTSLKAEDLPDNLSEMRSAIEAKIPHGRTDNGSQNDRGAWGVPTEEAEAAMNDHWAGRSMSRGEAKRRFTVDDHAEATKGVECRKDEGVIDETPAAYKSIDAVMAAQSDLIEVVRTLRQVICVKG